MCWLVATIFEVFVVFERFYSENKYLEYTKSCFIFSFFAASMLEIARLIVDSGSALHRPVIFLFNGAEELFMLVGYLICKCFELKLHI